jgi:signal transduction histidine kinase
VNGRRFVIDVPEEPLDASADREKVRQVLANLVDNAVKFSPEGAAVTVAARRTDDLCRFVSPTRSRCAAGEQERIFRSSIAPMPRVLRRVEPGSTVYRARPASAMGGRLWIDAETGRGASFVFELPTDAPTERR